MKDRETQPQERGQVDEIKKHLTFGVRDIAVNVPRRNQKWNERERHAQTRSQVAR